MDADQIELKLPEGWYIRETESGEILVMIPPDNPGSVAFRPSVVISTTPLGDRTVEQDIDLGIEQLQSVVGSIERSPVQSVDLDHLVNSYSYELAGVDVQVTEYRSVKDGLSLNVTTSVAAVDEPEMGKFLAALAQTVHFKGAEPWPASKEAVSP